MLAVMNDFDNRVEEIDLYFSLLKQTVDKKQEEYIQIEQILKANAFLMLYNLAESCIKNAVEEIFSDISKKKVGYHKLREEIRIELIKSLKKDVISPKSFVERTRDDITKQIIGICFDKDKLLSGNVDARQIQNIASIYSFSTQLAPIEYEETKTNILTDKLLVVKNNRNSLAHGNKSFKECGRDYTYNEMVEIKIHVVKYLQQILQNIEIYIQNEEYLLDKVKDIKKT